MDKSGAGTGFLRELRFPLPLYISSASPQSSALSPEAGTIGQEWPQCQYPHRPNKKKGSQGVFPTHKNGLVEIMVFWGVTGCCLVDTSRRFGGTYSW
jgi:hypothetical protein